MSREMKQKITDMQAYDAINLLAEYCNQRLNMQSEKCHGCIFHITVIGNDVCLLHAGRPEEWGYDYCKSKHMEDLDGQN